MTSNDEDKGVKRRDPGRISSNARDHKTRQSLQLENIRPNKFLSNRMTQSHNFGKSKPRLMASQSAPTIPEVESDEENASGSNFEVINETKRSGSKESVSERSKKISSVSKKSSTSGKNGFAYDNPAYEGSTSNGVSQNPSRKTSKTSLGVNEFKRGGNVSSSVRSSAHDPSVASMEVQREQYCCFTRWSPCEKRLAVIVAILGAIILGLVITVGVLAGHKGETLKFNWHY